MDLSLVHRVVVVLVCNEVRLVRNANTASSLTFEKFEIDPQKYESYILVVG